MTGGVITFMGCKTTLGARMSLICFQNARVRDNCRTRSKFLPRDVFYALQVSFEQIQYAFAKKFDKLFRTTLKEMTFALVGKRLELLESRRILCFFRPKT